MYKNNKWCKISFENSDIKRTKQKAYVVYVFIWNSSTFFITCFVQVQSIWEIWHHRPLNRNETLGLCWVNIGSPSPLCGVYYFTIWLISLSHHILLILFVFCDVYYLTTWFISPSHHITLICFCVMCIISLYDSYRYHTISHWFCLLWCVLFHYMAHIGITAYYTVLASVMCFISLFIYLFIRHTQLMYIWIHWELAENRPYTYTNSETIVNKLTLCFKK